MRLNLPTPDTMTADQRAIHDEAVVGKRGSAPPPMLAWLHSPEMARHAARLGAVVRYDTTLTPALSELAILVTARHWSSHYEWFVHKRMALEAGLPLAIVVAINARQTPAFDDPVAQIVYDCSRAIHETHGLSDDMYARAKTALGDRGVVELVGILGYYTLISMTLNTFEIGLPEGEVSDLKP